jgi:acyl carrier protein
MASVEERVIQVFAEHFGKRSDEIGLLTKLDDVGDSLDEIDLLIKMEAEFDIDIPAGQDWKPETTVKDIIKSVETLFSPTPTNAAA